jgi:pyridoxamine 5'-phosphate oxidase
MTHDPIAQFHAWFAEAKACEQILEPTAMALATATPQGKPSLRMVLLKGADEKGFTFFTNAESQKGQELRANPQAELCFYWMPLMRQIRIGGRVEKVSDTESDEYYRSRMLISQIGAWASKQSQPLTSREELLSRVEALKKQYEGQTIPRPPHWHGWRVIPDFIEFWQEGDYRLHHRERYTRNGKGWSHTLLNP